MAYEMKPGTAYLDIPVVREHFDLAAQTLVNQTLSRFVSTTRFALRQTEFQSPLEVLFYIWWDMVCALDQHHLFDLDLCPQEDVILADRLYRLDFLIRPANPKVASHPQWTPLAVEVDGHAFHERTPDQVMERDQRDRALQVAGWKVFHFSYREFTSRPAACIEEVRAFAVRRFTRANYQLLLDTHMGRDVTHA